MVRGTGIPPPQNGGRHRDSHGDSAHGDSACPVLLALVGGDSSDEAVVCQHVGADSGASASGGLTEGCSFGKTSFQRLLHAAASEKKRLQRRRYRVFTLPGTVVESQ
jgi:hypothetical protein